MSPAAGPAQGATPAHDTAPAHSPAAAAAASAAAAAAAQTTGPATHAADPGPAYDPAAHPVVAEEIARLWTDALGQQPASHDTDFFEAGGTSLALVRFLGGVQDSYGVELPMDQLFTGGFSVSYAAAAVEELLLAGADPDELNTLVAELDALSDDEIRVLLAEES